MLYTNQKVEMHADSPCRCTCPVYCCRWCAACAPMAAARAAMPAGLGATEAVRSSPGGSACAAPTGMGVMRRAEVGGQPSRLISEIAGWAA